MFYRPPLRVAVAVFVVLGAYVVARAAAPATTPATTRAAGFYEGFKRDLELLRDVREWSGPGEQKKVRGSTPAAEQAAARIFGNVGFLHRSRAEVLRLLGDPKTVSDFGRPDAGGDSDPLVYVFDVGWAASTYTLTFRGGRCVGVAVEFGA